jgi:hypothetical protein
MNCHVTLRAPRAARSSCNLGLDKSFEAAGSCTRLRLHDVRRTFVCGIIALAAGITVTSPACATSVRATPAGTFYNALGINAHPWYPNNAWPQRLVELGVPNVRSVVNTSTDYVTKMQPFFRNGGKVNSVILSGNSGMLDRAQASKNLAFLKNTVGLQYVSGIEGPNEFNDPATRPSYWASIEREFVKWLHDTVRADFAFRTVPLIAPSSQTQTLTDYQALGDLSSWVDKGCIHHYSWKRRPTITGAAAGGTMAQALKYASILAPGKPIWMTETGWYTAGSTGAVSQRTQAKYVLRNYFDAFGYGVEKIFVYQLMDNQSKLYGLTDPYANPKPAFYALKNLAALVRDAGGGTGSLDYSLSGAPAGLKQMLLQKSDGSFLLVLWLDVESYGSAGDIETVVPMTVKLARFANFEVYQPTFSSTTQSQGMGTAITVPAADQVTIVRIR